MKNTRKKLIPTWSRGPAQSALSHHLTVKAQAANGDTKRTPIVDVDDNSILDVDVSEYEGSAGKLIRIRIIPELQDITVHMTITTDFDEIEKGNAKQSPHERGCWLYKTKRKKPVANELVVTAWVMDYKDGLAMREVIV